MMSQASHHPPFTRYRVAKPGDVTVLPSKGARPMHASTRWLVFTLLGFVCAASAKGEPGMTGDLSRVDHVILGINDLERGIEELERLTGVRAVFGGAHPGRGTHNALISLGGSQYLEILAPNPKDESPAWIGELKSLTTLTPVGWAAKGEDL